MVVPQLPVGFTYINEHPKVVQFGLTPGYHSLGAPARNSSPMKFIDNFIYLISDRLTE